jgi:CHAT domain-containing protein
MVEAAVIDLAAALQKAVIRMKRTPQTRLPYHWAAFVVHGACFMKYAG